MNALFPPPPPTACCRRGLTSPPGYSPGNLRADIAAAATPRRVVAPKMMQRMCDVCVVFTEYLQTKTDAPAYRQGGSTAQSAYSPVDHRRAAGSPPRRLVLGVSHERMMHNDIYQVMFVPSSAGNWRRGRVVAGFAAARSAVPERSTASRVTEGVRR